MAVSQPDPQRLERDLERDQWSDQKLELARRSWRDSAADTRRYPRRRLGDGQRGDGPLGKAGAGEGLLVLDRGVYPPMPVELFDISVAGACVLVPRPLVVTRGDGGDLQLTGEPNRRVWVCWSEQRAEVMAVGVAFDDLLAMPA